MVPAEKTPTDAQLTERKIAAMKLLMEGGGSSDPGDGEPAGARADAGVGAATGTVLGADTSGDGSVSAAEARVRWLGGWVAGHLGQD